MTIVAGSSLSRGVGSGGTKSSSSSSSGGSSRGRFVFRFGSEGASSRSRHWSRKPGTGESSSVADDDALSPRELSLGGSAKPWSNRWRLAGGIS